MNPTRSTQTTHTSRLGLTLAAASLAVASLSTPSVAAAESKLVKSGPGVLVLSGTNFSLEEYRAVRASLERQGLEVRVAAPSLAPAIPWGGSTADAVQPDLPIWAVEPARVAGIVFVGGWGASAYQYAFSGTYANALYRPDPLVTESVNRLIGALLALKKPVAGICHGVTVLAWARVDGVSPLRGRKVAAWAGGGPGFTLGNATYADATIADRWHVEQNGGVMPLSAAVGDPTTSGDDVIVDGHIITAENPAAAEAFGRAFVGGIHVAAGDL